MPHADGDTVQTYEYSIYGQVAASDVNHPNPYMFTGRRFDVETGLYYYRARMYDPYTGRFLQTDPIGYQDGINWYAYCGNNPGNMVDPSGLDTEYTSKSPGRPNDPCDFGIATGRMMVLPWRLDPTEISNPRTLSDYLEWIATINDTYSCSGFVINVARARYTKAVQALLSPTSFMVAAYTRMAQAWVDASYNIAAIDQMAWRPFIEVQRVRWKMVYDVESEHCGQFVLEDGKYVRENLGDPYWVEVEGFRTGIDGAAKYLNGCGYQTGAEAWAAGIRGIDNYMLWTLGRMPQDLLEKEYTGSGFSGEYRFVGPVPGFVYTGPETRRRP